MTRENEDAAVDQHLPISPLPFAAQLQDVVPIEIHARRFPVELADGISVNIHANIDGIAVDTEQRQAQVIVMTSIEPIATTPPFEISVRVLGLFTYSDEYKADEVKAYLEASSLSLMLPFLRELIHHLSMRLQIPAIAFPLMQLAHPTGGKQSSH